MSLFICSLNSGSNGNCYYVGNEQEAVLIDAGLSCRETEKRMKGLGLSMQKVKAVFISHEHTDHIRGIESIVKKFALPVYITSDTLRFGGIRIGHEYTRSFSAEQPISVGSLEVHAFPKLHDASDPYSFVVCGAGIRVGVFTDIGLPCAHLIRHFSQCHAAFLEANYDDRMLDEGGYPFHLKRRIRGGKGHLSNKQALDVFLKHRPSYMSHLLLSHLSQNNNRPELVEALFQQYAGATKIVVASRHAATPVYQIREEVLPVFDLPAPPPQIEVSQLEFSFC
jgi:phosphoribosyl 1,2-cyclic phosphodiesterase